jgi:glutamyl-tRNA synthetase
MTNSVRTRIAPSPTGEDIHVGNLYTAYLSFVYAKKNNGQFIVRVEDTDRERLVPGSEERILKTLEEYGVKADESPLIGGPYAPYRQSDRLDIYKEYIKPLLENKTAYYCICTKERLDELRASQMVAKQTPRYDKHCLLRQDEVKKVIDTGNPYVIRLDIPKNQEVTFTDVIRGDITFNTNDLDDQVLIKSDGFPTYHFAVVVDDYLMKVTHILRGDDWIPSTPKHVLLYQAFGWELPVFCHVPLLRNPDKSKLSKRKNPVWSHWYLEQGYLREAMLNFLVLMGWSHPEGKEIFSEEEFMKFFDIKDLKPVGPAFDLVKLKWMNQQYIQNLSGEDLKKRLQAFTEFAKVMDEALLDHLVPLVKTRMQTLVEFEELTKHFVQTPEISVRSDQEKEVAQRLAQELEKLEKWQKEEILVVFRKIMDTYRIRMPILYYVLTGAEKGLPLPESVEILGKEKTLARLKRYYD